MRTGVAMTMTEDGLEIRPYEPMARHTSWRAGGAARRYVIPASLDGLQTLLAESGDDEAVKWLGLGSNVLVRDGGFDGTIVATRSIMQELERTGDGQVYVGAGVADAKLARFCQRQGWAGAEFFAGIPGVVGGALAMNAGAWGGETWRHVLRVRTMNRQGQLFVRQRDDFTVGYRHVAPRYPGEWFVGAWLTFDNTASLPGGAVDIRQLLAKRAAQQPTGVASCGSVFRNPPGDHAARLIEDCGLKGYRRGGAVVSAKHANFIVNDQQASAADIESLIEHIRKTVLAKHGIELQTEVEIIGEPSA